MLHCSVLILASAFEIGWVMGIKHAHSLPEWAGTFLCIGLSFLLLTWATRRMGASMAYVLFVVFGTLGSYLIDVLCGKEMTPLSVAAIIILLFSIVELNREENR